MTPKKDAAALRANLRLTMAAAKEQAAAAEERAGKAETNAQITADVDAAGKLEKELAAAARVVHMNVFEDGLTDSPAAVGLPADYTDRLDRLLRALSDDGAGNLFTCFKSARDLGALPPIAPLTSAEALFGVVDLVYNVRTSAPFHARAAALDIAV